MKENLKWSGIAVCGSILACVIGCTAGFIVTLPILPICAEPWKETTALYFTETSGKYDMYQWVSVRVEDGSIQKFPARSTDKVGCKVVVRRKSSIFGWNVQYERSPEP